MRPILGDHVWRRPVLGAYGAAAFVVGQHLLSCRLRYIGPIWPELGRYLPWWLLVLVGLAGVACGVWAYRAIAGWAAATIPFAAGAAWLTGQWQEAFIRPGQYDVVRHEVSTFVGFVLLVVVWKAWTLDHAYGREILNADGREDLLRAARQGRPTGPTAEADPTLSRLDELAKDGDDPE